MTTPKVSIITASHGRPDFLRRCIMAIQKQSFREYEHLVVADHCPYSEKVYNQFKEDSHLVFSTTDGPHVYNRGGMSKNKGIKIARGDYICYCDDDNILLPNHVELLYNKITSKDFDACFSKMYHIRHHYEFNHRKILEKPIFDHSGCDLKSRNPGYTHYCDEDCEISSTSKFGPRIGCCDMLACIHKKKLPNDLHVWPCRFECKNPEDDVLMARLFHSEIKIGNINEHTNIYNAHQGHADTEWNKRIQSMREDQVYIYEEIVPKF